VIAAFEWWNGVWSPPARYWTTFVPLLAAPLAMSLALIPGRLYKAIYGLLALPGFVFMAVLMDDPRRLFPHQRGLMFGWLAEAPESPLHLDLRKVLPYFTPPEVVTHPLTTAGVIAIALAIVLACYLLIIRQRRLNTGRVWSPSAHMSVWLGVFALVGAGWLGMNFEHLKPKTVLTQVGEWELSPQVDQPRGIAFNQGKLYVTGYESRSLVALDVASGTSGLVQPVSSGTPLTYTHPGGVEVGPDGLLYVLNNGDGPAALFAMQRGGEVVRQIPLEGKSPIAVGLDFGPDGDLYLSDMLGGKIFRYPAGGGVPLDVWGGLTGGFNNISGIVVDDEGTVFAAEQSERRVQQLDREGNFVRSYDLRCNPMFMAQDGDWLDVSCDNRLLSINRSTHDIRSVRVTGDGALPNAPIGLAYGPDGTLYVVSENRVLAYDVQR
jgi:hypothetical protein